MKKRILGQSRLEVSGAWPLDAWVWEDGLYGQKPETAGEMIKLIRGTVELGA